MTESFDHHWQAALDELRNDDRLRILRMVESRTAHRIILQGRRLLNFSSNDYLGLSTHPQVIEAGIQALRQHGAGGSASRLVSGNLELYHQLEIALARLKNAEAALVFPSGYHANVGIITALVGIEDRVVMDRLVHASLVDGARLSRARLEVFPHNDPEALNDILGRHKRGKTLVLSESVFSMDGDIAPARELLGICEKHQALLLLDDAHGFGVIGQTGRGIQERDGLNSPYLILMGTLSKAMGALGGYIVGSQRLIDYLLNRARSLIYTTALPPATLASALAALQVAFEDTESPTLLDKLRQRLSQLRQGLEAFGYPDTCGETAIVPFFVGEDKAALELADWLMKRGLFAPAIRPPTVPAGTARIRFSLSALHEPQDIDLLLGCLGDWLHQHPETGNILPDRHQTGKAG